MNITALILTYNEELHIERCINSLGDLCDRIVVLDSYSNDATISIAKKLGANIIQHRFVNQADQINWFLNNFSVKTEWIFRVDADEIVSHKLIISLKNEITSLSQRVAGITVNRKIFFLGKWIRHGGVYPISVLRVWRSGMGKCENRLMDEHIIVSGETVHIEGSVSDINLNNLTWWIDKHNNYATREAIEILLNKKLKNKTSERDFSMSRNSFRKRWVKERIYSNIPPGFRAILYFMYRYILRFGFLDGSKGFIFHCFQGFWYRLLVDAKVWEIKDLVENQDKSIEDFILEEYGDKYINTRSDFEK